MNMKEFKEEIYEIAFGDNAINRNWDEEEVVAEIQKFEKASWLDEDEVVKVTEALDYLSRQLSPHIDHDDERGFNSEAPENWESIMSHWNVLVAALNKFMVDGGSFDYRKKEDDARKES